MRLVFMNSNGQALDFFGMDNVAVFNIEGLGPTELTKGTLQKAYSDGIIINSTARAERQVIINLALEGGRLNDCIRRKIYSVIGDKRAGFLRYTDEEIDVFTEAYAEAPQVDTWTLEPTMQISFICPSAFFKDFHETVLDLSYVNPQLQFPLAIPEETGGMVMGEETPAVSGFTLINHGQASTGVKIVVSFTQAVTGVKIANESNGDVLTVAAPALIGGSFQAGDVLTITTETGEKGAILYRAGTYTDIFSAVSYGEQWLRIERGRNVLRYSHADSADTAGLLIKISFNALYWGI